MGNSINHFNDYELFIKNPDFGNLNPYGLHVNLIPIPYVDSIRNVSIFVLLLNPGFAPMDYYAESHSIEYRDRLIANLRQEVGDLEFPNFFLDPNFIYPGGG